MIYFLNYVWEINKIIDYNLPFIIARCTICCSSENFVMHDTSINMIWIIVWSGYTVHPYEAGTRIMQWGIRIPVWNGCTGTRPMVSGITVHNKEIRWGVCAACALVLSERSEVAKRAGSNSLLYSRVQYMCKSTEICDVSQNIVLKFFFARLPALVFLIVCSIYKRNSWLNMVHQMVYFS